MNRNEGETEPASGALRERAEAYLRAQGTGIAGAPATDDAQRLIHELQVHQIELEMQNEELRDSRDEVELQRARYTELYDFAPNGYVTLSADGTMAETNRAAAALLERQPGTLRGKRFGLFVAETDRSALSGFLARVFATGEPQHCELALAVDGQAPRIVRMEGTRSPSGEECNASLSDITARRRAEAALRLRDRAIRAVSQGIVITDPNLPGNPIIYTNPGFELVTGYSSTEVAGRNCRFLQGKDTDRAVVARLRAALEAGEPCSVELLNYRKDGAPFWNSLFVTPVRDDGGHVTQFIGVQMDVTERRDLERTLQQSQRMEAVGRLAGGIAHDFNNLLTVINGYTDLLHGEMGADDPHRKLVREIGEAGERAATLTHQLMAFSRSQVLDPTVLDLNAVVTELGSMLRRLVGETITMRSELETAPVRVRVDAGQIGQVIVNLAVNARDAMPDGGTLTIRTENVTEERARSAGHPEVKPGAYALISISDTGVGMTPETAARIFEPFFTPRSVGVGSGLGLSMVYGLVRQSEGDIAVQSVPGRGTTFTICLPAVLERV